MELIKIIDTELKKKRPLVIALEGRCGSGKSTLARRLCGVYRCSVIQMDHFFLQPEQRIPARLNEPGGNIDYERFEAEVAQSVREKKREFSYHRYDCRTGTANELIPVRSEELIIVEGVYSCHPRFADIYDLKFFLDIDEEEQIRRIRKRSGEEMLKRFVNEWIPMEEKYFAEFRIREGAHVIKVHLW